MKYGALSILHTLLAQINFCFNQDNHKQTMHDVKFNIKLVVINCINLSLC